MGYIIPLTNYQSIHYLERTLFRGRDPYQYEGVVKIVPVKNQPSRDIPSSQLSSLKVPDNQLPNRKLEQEVNQVTGKGILFDARI